MTDTSKVKAVASYSKGGYLDTDGSFVFYLPRTSTPMARIKPDVVAGAPALVFFRIHPESNSEEHLLTIQAQGIRELVRWLPVLVNNARRKVRRRPPPHADGNHVIEVHPSTS